LYQSKKKKERMPLGPPLLIFAGIVVVAATAPAIGSYIAASLVPVAMQTFGTVVTGVGTLHASAAAGGVAATLQSVAAGLATAKAAAISAGTAAAVVGAAAVAM
jgi:hypothetical protein